MDTTRSLLERLRSKYATPDNPCSDYRLAKILGIAKTAGSRYTAHRGGMSNEVGLRLAAELELPPEYVVVCLSAEREQSDQVKPVWERMAADAHRQIARPTTTRRRAAKVAAMLAVAGIAAFGASPPSSASPGLATGSVYYGKRRGMRFTHPRIGRPRRPARRRTLSPAAAPIEAAT